MPVPCRCCALNINDICYLPELDDITFYDTFANQAPNRVAGPGANTFTFNNWAGSGVDVRIAVNDGGEILGVAPGPQLAGSLLVDAAPPTITTVYVMFSEPVYLRRFGITDLDCVNDDAWGFDPQPFGAYGVNFFRPLGNNFGRPPVSENPLGKLYGAVTATTPHGVEFDGPLTSRLWFTLARDAGCDQFLTELGFETQPLGRAFCFNCGGPLIQYFNTDGDEIPQSQIITCPVPVECKEQELLINGDFTQPAIISNAETSFQLFNPQTLVAGWEMNTVNMEFWPSNFLVPNHPNGGTRKHEMNGTGADRTFQVIDVPAAAGDYHWGFSHKSRPGSGVNSVELRIGDAANPLNTNPVVFTSTLPANDVPWHDYSGIYSKPAGVTKVRFELGVVLPAAGGVGNVIDLCTFRNVCQENPRTCSLTPIPNLHLEGRSFDFPGEHLQFSVTPTATTATGVGGNQFRSSAANPVSPCGGRNIDFDWENISSLDIHYHNGESGSPVTGITLQFSTPDGFINFPIFISGWLPGQSETAAVPGHPGVIAKITHIFSPTNTGNAPRSETPFCGTPVGFNVFGVHRANFSSADFPVVLRLEFFEECTQPVAETLAVQYLAFDDSVNPAVRETLGNFSVAPDIISHSAQLTTPGYYGRAAVGGAPFTGVFVWEEPILIEMDYGRDPAAATTYLESIFQVFYRGGIVSWPAFAELAINGQITSDPINGRQIRLTALSGPNGTRPRRDPTVTNIRIGVAAGDNVPVRYRLEVI